MGWFPQIDNRPHEIAMMIPQIRTIIADDEPADRDRLQYLLSGETGVELVAECNEVAQTLQAVRTQKPDLLVLDIQMQDAVQVLNPIAAEHLPLVILTSTDDHHAVKAFQVRALDYLLKPISEKQIHSAIERTRAREQEPGRRWRREREHRERP